MNKNINISSYLYMENKDIILIILVIIVLYLLFCDNRKIKKLEENFAATTSVTTSPVDEEIKNKIDKYLAERRDIPITESIKNLGILAKKLQDGGITIPGNITIPEDGKIIFKGPGNAKSEIFFNKYADGLEIAQRNCSTLRLYQNGNGFDLQTDSIKKTHASNIKIEDNVELKSNKNIQWSNGGKIRADNNGEMWINWDNKKKVTFGGDVNIEGNVNTDGDVNTDGSMNAGTMGANKLYIDELHSNDFYYINVYTTLDMVNNAIRFYNGNTKIGDISPHNDSRYGGWHLHIAGRGGPVYAYGGGSWYHLADKTP